jgi:hypothetical protein
VTSVPGSRQRLTIVPAVWEDVQKFVTAHHRHHPAPVAMKFCLALADGDEIVGVASVGWPVARHLMDGWTLEVNRTCVIDAPNGNSMLYGACWRAAKALGWRRLITYTQEGESGASLRGAGWRIVAERPARPGWDAPSRPRALRGTENVARTLWEAS